MASATVTIIVISFLAATVNGALGYGFSSISVPVLLLFLTNRLLNPALVSIEVPLNAYVLWVNRRSIPAVWRRVSSMIVGLVPGIVIGTSIVAQVHPGWVKLCTYAVLLPLILLQAAGLRRPIKNERRAGLAFGSGVGVLYSVTTISGPPLALMLNNQGVTREDFRAALGLVRLSESTFTAMAYLYAGLFTWQSAGLLRFLLPSVCLGIPLGAYLIRRLPHETFRRVCMSFDAWVVGFGLSTVLRDLRNLAGPSAYSVLAAVVIVDCALLWVFFSRQRRQRQHATLAAVSVPT